MSGTLKCEKCGAEVHEDRISIVHRRLFCDVCFGQYQKEKAAYPKMGNVCAIDDDCSMKSYCEEYLEDFEVTHLLRIPEDESALAEFDVLIVDGQGIGNSKFKKGFDFLKAYKPTGRNIGLIYHSGLINLEEGRECLSLGVECITKGRDPQELVDAVKGFFK